MHKNDKIMEGFYVKAHVGKKLRQYIIWSYGSDTIPLRRDATLTAIIKPHLALSPKDFIEPYPDDEIVFIEIPKIREKVYNHAKGKSYYCNTLWRDTLSNKGQKRVYEFFNSNMRNSFFIFMDGYTEAQYTNDNDKCYLKIKEGIAAFFSQYHIDYNEKMIAAYARSWYRHREENEKNMVSPLVF